MITTEDGKYRDVEEAMHQDLIPVRKSNTLLLWMVIGYLFLFIFRPYEYWEFLGTLRIERIYMIIMLIMVALSNQTRFVPHKINRTVIGFFLVMVAASVFAFNSSDAFPRTFDYFKLIVFYFVIIMTIRDSDDLKTFVLAYLVITLMYFGKSAWEFFLHDSYWWRMGIKRMKGIDITYSDPNYFAATIAYSLPFWWGMIKFRVESRLMRSLLWLYGGLAIVCIIYSGSRSGMVTALLMLLLVWIASGKKMWGILLLPVLVIGIWLAMPESYKIRFESTFVEGLAEEAGQKGADASAMGRLAGLKMGFTTMLNHPVFGLGPGNFKYTWAGATGEVIGGSAHNLYGQILGELGLTGALAFIIFIVTVFRTHNSIRKKMTEELANMNSPVKDYKRRTMQLYAILSTASIQAMVLLLFNGNFGHNLYRYNYLWIGALAVLMSHFLVTMEKPVKRLA